MNNPISFSYRDRPSIFGQVYLNNKSLLNSSSVSTMISGNESLLLSSIQKNKKVKSFQRKNMKLKNDIKNIKRITVENFSYRNLILQRALINLSKKEEIKEDSSKNKSEIVKGYLDKIKKEINNIPPNSNLSNSILEIVYEKDTGKLSKLKSKKIILFKKICP